MNRRELIRIEIRYLIREHLKGNRDSETIIEAYMKDINNLEFREMIAYREYLNFSINKYYDSIDGFKKYIS